VRPGRPALRAPASPASRGYRHRLLVRFFDRIVAAGQTPGHLVALERSLL
jgi:hypothetical protein